MNVSSLIVLIPINTAVTFLDLKVIIDGIPRDVLDLFNIPRTEGTIYGALRALERSELITSNQARVGLEKQFTLTTKGKSYLYYLYRLRNYADNLDFQKLGSEFTIDKDFTNKILKLQTEYMEKTYELVMDKRYQSIYSPNMEPPHLDEENREKEDKPKPSNE